MESNVQHCTTCMTEYVASATACSDCGGRLSPGPPPDWGKRSVDEVRAAALQMVGSPGILLTTLPGLQADLVAGALVIEGIHCLLECEGQTQLRRPESPAEGPLAVALPVSIYVACARLEDARAILESVAGPDVIADQWQVEARDGETPFPEVEQPVASGAVDRSTIANVPAPDAEGTGLKMTLLLALAILALVLLLGLP